MNNVSVIREKVEQGVIIIPKQNNYFFKLTCIGKAILINSKCNQRKREKSMQSVRKG